MASYRERGFGRHPLRHLPLSLKGAKGVVSSAISTGSKLPTEAGVIRAEYHNPRHGRTLDELLTKEGIAVDRAELPAGNHRLVLKVRDSAERTTEREVRFTVQ